MSSVGVSGVMHRINEIQSRIQSLVGKGSEMAQQMGVDPSAGNALTNQDVTQSQTSFQNTLENTKTNNVVSSEEAQNSSDSTKKEFQKQKQLTVDQLRPMIKEIAEKFGLSPKLVEAVAKAESGLNANAISPKGAQGIMQLMPATQDFVGVKDPFDARQSLEGGAKYLKMMLNRFGDDVPKALAAYNAGPENVKKYNGVPPFTETQNYVRKVMSEIE
ncbi:MAG: lytic transglycosylase domain-containing protein [Candidatus Lindowbacteria bacterium]|nr:lytic transglycosylase domain-containing protein [Candidatus Lindowbacteria bacterium]